MFIPISFFPGTAGRLFSEFGFVLAFAVGLSMLVALTLTPMLASRILKEQRRRRGRHTATRCSAPIEAVGARAERLYHRLLDAALAAPAVVIVIALRLRRRGGLHLSRCCRRS